MSKFVLVSEIHGPYKMPMPNIAMTFNFFLRLIWRLASSDMGSNKIIMSWAMEIPELEYTKEVTSMQFEDKVLSHAPLTGLHWNIMANIKAMPLKIMNNMLRLTIVRNR